MTDLVEFGGLKYHWRGKYIRQLQKDCANYVTMPRKESIIILPFLFKTGEKYKISITSFKTGGNGKILVNFFANKKNESKHFALNIVSVELKEYSFITTVPSFITQDKIYLRVWRPSTSTGTVVIRSIKIEQTDKEESACIIKDADKSVIHAGKSNIKAIENKPKETKVYSIPTREQRNKRKEMIQTVSKKKQANKTILYLIDIYPHKRAFEKIKERDNIDQYIVAPKPEERNGLILKEEYDNFEIGKNNIIYYNNKEERNNIIYSMKPDALVEASLLLTCRIPSLQEHCKKVYVSHGMVGTHVKDLATGPTKLRLRFWKGCDLYCGATQMFSDFVKFAANVGDDKILLNAIPQFDLLCDKEYQKRYKDEILSYVGAQDKDKTILFAGFCCANREDFYCHNEDYFKTSIKLEELARKNNWFVFIKPRLPYEDTLYFLDKQDYAEKYIDDYVRIKNSNNVFFLHPREMIYRYFFSDLMIMNGISTLETEMCASKKPVFVVRTDETNIKDYFGVKASGAIKFISDMYELEQSVTEYFSSGLNHWPDEQEKLIKSFGLTIDGKMTERVQDRLEQMLLEI